jgi:truncated hemoglobin YjbI
MEMQRQFLTYTTGGAQEYHGKSMLDIHKGRGIETLEFDRVALHVVTTLQDLDVSIDLINDVVALLLPIRKQISDDIISESNLQSLMQSQPPS